MVVNRIDIGVWIRLLDLPFASYMTMSKLLNITFNLYNSIKLEFLIFFSKV